MLLTDLLRNVINGFYRGTVLKHCKNGKCKIWIPSIYPEESVRNPDILPDAEQASPLFGGSSNGSGMFSYPRVNSNVWCFFQNGDLNLPVYFAACNGGPEATQQYNEIGSYDHIGLQHDCIIDATDKISDASVHKINTSRSQISFYEDGTITTAISKQNKLAVSGNVNIPYSKSNNLLNILSNVIFPSQVTEAEYVSDSEYPIHTTDVISGLNNDAFAITCLINADPASVFSQLTSQLDTLSDLQCRSVYSKQGSASSSSKQVSLYYQDSKNNKLNTFAEVFCTKYKEDEDVPQDNDYVLNERLNLPKTVIDGIEIASGTVVQLRFKAKAGNITALHLKIVKSDQQACKVFIAAEDCKIDKWDYIKNMHFDLYLCSPSQFDNPVQYFDKPLYDKYSKQCALAVWPKLVNSKVSKYGASIVIIEDRRNFIYHEISKTGTIKTMLSDSFDEAYELFEKNVHGLMKYNAYKQNYLDYNKGNDYSTSQPILNYISGYNCTNAFYSNCNSQENAVLSLWNYQVRQCKPKDSSLWWYYNNLFLFDQKNGLSIFNDNLSIDQNPKYFKKTIEETENYPRWVDTKKLKERVSSDYIVNVNEGTAKLGINHLKEYDIFDFSRLTASNDGGISVETTRLADLFITDTRHKDGYIPYIKNKWTHVTASRDGELSVNETKCIELSVSDPYDLFNRSFMHIDCNGNTQLSNTNEFKVFTYTPGAKKSVSTKDWMPKALEHPVPPLHYSRIVCDKDGHIYMDCSQFFEFRTSSKHKMKAWDPDLTTLPRSHFKFDGNKGSMILDCCNTIELASTNGDITVRNDVKGNITVTTPKGNVVINTSSGNINITANGDVNVTASRNVNAVAGSSALIQAPLITLDGEVTVTGNLAVQCNTTVTGTCSDSGCTLATHTHPVIDTYTGGGASLIGQG